MSQRSKMIKACELLESFNAFESIADREGNNGFYAYRKVLNLQFKTWYGSPEYKRAEDALAKYEKNHGIEKCGVLDSTQQTAFFTSIEIYKDPIKVYKREETYLKHEWLKSFNMKDRFSILWRDLAVRKLISRGLEL